MGAAMKSTLEHYSSCNAQKSAVYVKSSVILLK